MNRLLEKCNSKNLKMTDQRKVIVQVLSESKDHPDVEAVYQRASKIDNKISIATVYRTIRLFEENNFLEKHEFKGFKSRYEPVSDDHHHLIDIKSGDVKEFRNTFIDAMQKQMANELGYKLVDYRLEIYAVPINDK
ncbi:MAG: transcriptional repressor [Rickettsiales bacterium]|nr:transcriptional repressor [Rickettsiales bacterium]OUV54024.1 MAG: transcriptional repressor [Rickettsiales bacterium TMED127]|tara:strand:- start:59966 stop:60373 length:408 start_codon:yes stop_codon:yes gene_type:complete